MTLTPDQKLELDALVNDLLDARAAIEKHEIIVKQLGEQIIARLGVGGRHEVVPGVGVRVQGPSQRFDAKKAQELLTADQYASICEAKPSATLAKKMLPGVLVEQLTSPAGSPSVRSL